MCNGQADILVTGLNGLNITWKNGGKLEIRSECQITCAYFLPNEAL
jgi:hypothetical protein